MSETVINRRGRKVILHDMCLRDGMCTRLDTVSRSVGAGDSRMHAIGTELNRGVR